MTVKTASQETVEIVATKLLLGKEAPRISASISPSLVVNFLSACEISFSFCDVRGAVVRTNSELELGRLSAASSLFLKEKITLSFN